MATDPVDVEAIKGKIRNVEVDNQKIRANNEIIDTRKQLTEKTRRASVLDEEVEATRQEKINLIQNAEYPVPGLSLGDAGVVFNGHPLEEASDAEKILLGIAIVAKMLPADGIRLLRVENGNKLDRANLAKIEEVAEREGVQIWLEIVSDEPGKGKAGTEIFIKDGYSVE